MISFAGCANIQFNPSEYARLVEFKTIVNEIDCTKITDASMSKLKHEAYYNAQYFENLSFRPESKKVAIEIYNLVKEFYDRRASMSDTYCTSKVQIIDAAIGSMLEIEGGMVW